MSPKTPKSNDDWDLLGISDVKQPPGDIEFRIEKTVDYTDMANSLADAEYHLKEFCRSLEDFNDDCPFELSVSLDFTIEAE